MIAIIDEAIRDILVNDATVSAITTRCYPVGIPQNPTWPLMVYGKITGVREHSLQGPTGMATPRYQIEAWAETYSGAKSLAKAMREALDGYRGTVGTVRIGSFLIQSERDIYEDAVGCYRVIQDYYIIHNE